MCERSVNTNGLSLMRCNAQSVNSTLRTARALNDLDESDELNLPLVDCTVNFLHPGGFLGSEPYNISFTLNTDGMNKYSSSNTSDLWPVYLMIEFSKKHRFEKKLIIPAYIYCDKHDPNMLTFLNPLIEKLKSFYETGIHVPGCGDGDITVRCMLFAAMADLPAQAAFMNMKQFNGKCACQLCKSEGTAYGQHNI